mgnify:CR=1 FL=1
MIEDTINIKTASGVMKTFVVFLNKLPEYPKCFIHDVEIDEYCLSELGRIYDGKDKT